MRTSTIDERFEELLECPTADRCTAVRDLIVQRSDYDPYSEVWQQVVAAFEARDYHRTLSLIDDLGVAGRLSPRLHFFAGVAAGSLGDQVRAGREKRAVQACLESLLATGEGTAERPFVVTYLWDAYDLLQLLQVVPCGQTLVDLGDARCDVIAADDGEEYWFDVTEMIDRRHQSRDGSRAASRVGSWAVNGSD